MSAQSPPTALCVSQKKNQWLTGPDLLLPLASPPATLSPTPQLALFQPHWLFSLPEKLFPWIFTKPITYLHQTLLRCHLLKETHQSPYLNFTHSSLTASTPQIPYSALFFYCTYHLLTYNILYLSIMFIYLLLTYILLIYYVDLSRSNI